MIVVFESVARSSIIAKKIAKKKDEPENAKLATYRNGATGTGVRRTLAGMSVRRSQPVPSVEVIPRPSPVRIMQ